DTASRPLTAAPTVDSERLLPGGEGDLNQRLQIHGLALPRGRAELPVRQSDARVFVQRVVHPAQDLHAIHAAVGANDGVERHHAFHVGQHQRRGIRGVHFVYYHRRGEFALVGNLLQGGEADDPTAPDGSQVGRIEDHRVVLARSEYFLLDRARRGRARRAGAGRLVGNIGRRASGGDDDV